MPLFSFSRRDLTAPLPLLRDVLPHVKFGKLTYCHDAHSSRYPAAPSVLGRCREFLSHNEDLRKRTGESEAERKFRQARRKAADERFRIREMQTMWMYFNA